MQRDTVMIQQCRTCSAEFSVTAEHLSFFDRASPVFQRRKHQIPPPAICPDCRKQRRLLWRNELHLYSRKCGLCGAKIISIYSPDKRYPVYCNDCWWSDAWSALQFGRPFDFNQTFGAQFLALQRQVPRLALFNSKSENSAYSNHAAGNKNCYMTSACFESENVYYSRMVRDSRDIVDCRSCRSGCELCYECILCEQCYDLKFSRYCKQCSSSAFLYDCHNCTNCCRCAGLRNKHYCYENKQYSKSEWTKLLEHISSYRALTREKEKFASFLLSVPHCCVHFTNVLASAGDDLFDCDNCQECFDMRNAQDCSFVELGGDLSDCYDCYGIGPGELLYEVSGLFRGYHCVAVNLCYFGSLLFYCDNCQGSNNAFGCIGLKKAEHCILNCQYSKQEYETLAGKVIDHMRITGEWGEFFAPASSPFGYNESLAADYFPMTKEQAEHSGFHWSNYQPPAAEAKLVLTKEQMADLPDDIKDTSDDILDWALTCEATGKTFRIVKPELKFYHENDIPPPRRSPEQRRADRMSLLNPRKLWRRPCGKCKQEILTAYSPQRPEIVCCEECCAKVVY
jgi:hypothetical protein